MMSEVGMRMYLPVLYGGHPGNGFKDPAEITEAAESKVFGDLIDLPV